MTTQNQGNQGNQGNRNKAGEQGNLGKAGQKGGEGQQNRGEPRTGQKTGTNLQEGREVGSRYEDEE